MENSYAQAAGNTKRFVVEDSITKVTSDGEPHGMMTMVAGLAGLLAAVIILAVLVSMVACRKHKKQAQQLGAVAMMSSLQQSGPSAGNLNAAFAESTLTLSVHDKDTDKLEVLVQRF